MLRRIFGAAGLAVLLAQPAAAGEAGDLLRKHLYAGTIHEGGNSVEALMRTSGETPEAFFSIGMLQFVRGIEELAQTLYRHGLAAPDTGRLGPDLALPVPDNPAPERLDYDTVRLTMLRLQREMDDAVELLLLAGRASGEGADFVVDVDPLQIRIDLDGDGAGDAGETMAAIFARAFGEDEDMFRPPAEPQRPTSAPPSLEPPAPPPSPRASSRSQRGSPPPRPAPAPFEAPAESDPPPAGEEQPQVLIGFDRADAIWLAGYANIIAAQADFLLAHDFSDLVNTSFHRLFPHAGLPMQGLVGAEGVGIIDPESDNAIADAIAAIHTLNWPVVEPDRLANVLSRARTVTGLSRENWAAILAETDDHFELVPSPRQTNLDAEMTVTEEIVDAWHTTLDTVDRVLAGELLLPHWRFTGAGFDLKAYFETAKRTDIVLILTGYGALPFIREGEVADQSAFAALNRTMGEDWLSFALWFN